MASIQLSKRDKKRRDVLDRLENRHAERWYKREEIYNEAITNVMSYGHQLAREPAQVPALKIPLYLLDLERDALLESIDTHWRYRRDSTTRLYELEMQKIEDEYKKSREAVRARLLDQIEERRRKVKEEKESTGDVVAETLLEAQLRPRPTRSRGRKSPSTSIGGSPPPPMSLELGPDSSLAALVNQADILLAALLPPTISPTTTDNIISSSTYSLAVLPAPMILEKGLKLGRRPGRGQQPLSTSGAAENGREPVSAGFWRGPALTGYAKVNGWMPGKSLDELKGVVGVNEMERERDLSAIKGYGRRVRGKVQQVG